MVRSELEKCILQVQCQMKLGCPTELEGKGESTAYGLTRSCWSQDGKKEMEYIRKMGVFDNGCKLLMLKWVDKMEGEKCRSRLVCREINRAKDRDEQLGPEDVFSRAAVGRVEDACVNNDDRTRRWKPRWRSIRDRHLGCVESTLLRWSSQVDLHMSTWRTWARGQVGQTLQEHAWNARRSVNLVRQMVRCVEREFHEGRICMHRFLLQSRWRSQRIVSWWRLLCGCTTEAVANFWKGPWEMVWGEANQPHWILCLHILRVARTFFSDTFSVRGVQTSRTRMAQCVCSAHVISLHLTFSLSCFIHRLCCSLTVTSTPRSRLHLPCRTVPDPKARVRRTSARAARSLAPWPIPHTPQVMSPKSSTRLLLQTVTRRLSTIRTTITSLTSQKSHARALDCSVFPRC